MQPAQIPVIESLLTTPASLDGFPALGFLDQRFGLAALGSLGEEGLAQRLNFLPRVFEPGRDESGSPCRSVRFLKAGDTIHEVAAIRAGCDQPSSAALTFGCGGESSL